MSDLETALAQLKARQEPYRLYRDYYSGKHNLTFATEKYRSAFGSLFKEFASNLCPAVVDAVADRLEVTGFSVEGRPEQSAPGQQRPRDLGDDAWDIWQKNRMDTRAGQVHLEALREGDSYAIVWPQKETGKPVIYPQKAAHCYAAYDEEEPGKILWAAKAWQGQADKKLYLTLYYPDRLEKWVSTQKVDTFGMLPEKQASFEERQVAGEAWPILNPWQTVPLFHFSNNGDCGCLGDSELTNVIPLQDALNKSIADMLVGMEYVALPQRWVTGMEIATDERTGQPIAPFIPGVTKLWVSESEKTQLGQFPNADLAQLIAVQDSFRMEIARVSGTPLHYMMLQSGTPPSGEALKTQEARLIKKCRDRASSYGNSWEDLMRLALAMSGKDGIVALSTQWVDPAPRSETERATNTAALTSAGASLYAAARVSGYSETEAQELQRVDMVDGLRQ